MHTGERHLQLKLRVTAVRVVDDPELRKLLLKELPLVVFESLAAVQMMDREAASRAKNNLIIYMVSAPTISDLLTLSALLSAVEAVLRSDRPCSALSLASHALNSIDLVRETIGVEAAETLRTLHERLSSSCRAAFSFPKPRQRVR